MKRSSYLKALFYELIEDIRFNKKDLLVNAAFNKTGELEDYDYLEETAFDKNEIDITKNTKKDIANLNTEFYCILPAIQVAALVIQELKNLSFDYSIIAVYKVANQISSRSLASQVGLSPQAISNYDNGVKNPSLENMEKLYAYFKVPAKYRLLPHQYFEMQKAIKNLE